jgi:hypothetical protein
LRGLPGLTSNVADTANFFRREISEQKARRVITVGYSLGGYAALLFGHLLGADEVQAVSPQTFISLMKRWHHGDHRWQRWILKLHCSRALFEPLDLRPVLTRSNEKSKYVLHYASDSRLDVLHAKRLGGLPGVTLREHASGSHRLVTALRDSGEMRAILEQSLRG